MSDQVQGQPIAPITTSSETRIAQPAPVAVQPPAQTEAKSAEFAALARKEKAIREASKAFKAEKAAWEADRANWVPKERLSKETLAVLAEAGIQPHQLAETLLNAPQPLSKAEVELETLKAKIASLEAAKAEETEGSVAQALRQIAVDATGIVKARPQEFEMLNAEGQAGIDEVVSLMKGVFEQEGTILDIREAAQMIETQLEEDKFKEVEKLSKLSKLQKRLKPQPASQVPGAIPGEAQSQAPETKLNPKKGVSYKVKPRPQVSTSQKVRTITNSMTNTTRELSARERAILAFKGQLTG